MNDNAAEPYPLRFDVVRPESQSRLTNFPLGIGMFIRLVLAIPHLAILYFFQAAGSVIYIIATFAILFTGRYPEGIFRFYLTYMRWAANVCGYILHLYDKYPPFGGDAQPDYPLSLELDYPENLSRLLNAPLLGALIKAVLLIPHYVVLVFLGIAAFVVLFLATFAILFSGSFPEGMHRFVVGVMRWSQRVTAYQYALTDKYPPFSIS